MSAPPSSAGRLALAISSSGELCSVAVRDADGAIRSRHCPAKLQSRALIGLIDELLGPHARRNLGEVRIDRGPGSYTGLRMALTFARVLASFDSLPIRTATSLELLAIAAWRRGQVSTDRPVRPILDARRERWHTARLELRAGRVTFAQEPIALPVERARESIASDEVVLAGPTVLPLLGSSGEAAPLPALEASDLFDAALDPVVITPEQLEPLYLMGPYTE